MAEMSSPVDVAVEIILWLKLFSQKMEKAHNKWLEYEAVEMQLKRGV